MNPHSSLPTTTNHHPSVRNSRFFTGWIMLGIAAAAQYLSAPGQSYSVAAFKDPMQNDLGISDTDFSAAYAFATICSACLLPFVGKLVDRFGARIMLPLIALGLGSSCLMMSKTDSLTSLYLSFGLVRSMGQGAMSLVSIWLIGEWFERRRGMATAIAGLGGGLSMMTFPLINHWLIVQIGWERTWSLLAMAVWAILILPVLVIVRNRPEDVGLHPDGIEPEAAPAKSSSVEPSQRTRGPMITALEDSWTVREVLRDSTFWKLITIPTTAALVLTGLTFHQVALLGSHGLTRTWALGLISLQAGFSMLMTLPAGWVTDRLASRYLLVVSMVALALANCIVLTMPAIWWAILYAFLLGIAGAVLQSTGCVVWINYYGRAHQGAVRGVAWSTMILASAIGPLPLALSIDRFGSYNPALYLFLALPLASAAAVWTAYPPRRQAETPT